MRSVVIKSIDAADIRRRMDAHAGELLATHPEIEEIVVFGSFQTGTWAPGSDLDVFVVLSRADLPIADRAAPLMPRGFPIGMDLFAFTREEMAARSPSPLLDAVARSDWRYRRS